MRLAGRLLDHVSKLVREQRTIGLPAPWPEPDMLAAREGPRPGGAGCLTACVDPHPAEVVTEALAHGLAIRPGKRLAGTGVRRSVPGRLQALEDTRRPSRARCMFFRRLHQSVVRYRYPAEIVTEAGKSYSR